MLKYIIGIDDDGLYNCAWIVKNEKEQKVTRSLTRYECETKCREVGFVPMKAKKVDVTKRTANHDRFWVGCSVSIRIRIKMNVNDIFHKSYT